jgi:YidC/Oxa1 family membrane protein insertase
MDRNQVIGFLLIGAILVGFSIFNQPTPEELAALKHQRDSIENVEKALSQQKVKQQEISATVAAVNDSLLGDSAISSRDEALYGAFSAAANGENAVTTMENEVFKVHISNKGGRIKSVELKKYKTFYGTPVTLFEGDSTRFSLNFFSQNKTISTADLYFRPIGKSAVVKEGQAASLTMRLEASPGQYIDYIYTIKGNSYLLDYNISFVGINNLVAANTGYMELDWMQHLKNQEREAKNERLYSTIYYQYDDGENEVDYITETTDEKEELKTK